MTNDQIVWTMVTTYLADYYAADNVFLRTQNNYTPPTIDEFVLISNLRAKQRYTPNRNFNSTTQEKEVFGYNDIHYQLDLYGTVAADAMDRIYTLLSSVVISNFLIQYNTGIGYVDEPKNLTNVNDRDNYMTRYTLLFSMLANNKITVSASGIALDDITINLKEYT